MQKQKISKSIASALAYLKEAADPKGKENEKMISMQIWRASSNLEYALFLFSIIEPRGNTYSSWKPTSKEQQTIEILLPTAIEALKEATNYFKNGNIREAYKTTWKAKNQLLQIQDLLEKKERKT